MKSLVIGWILLFFVFTCNAQLHSGSLPRIKTAKDFSAALMYFYKPNQDSIKNTCWEGCLFVRFSINNDRQIVNTAFSKTAPGFMISAFQKAVQEINSNEVTMTGQQKDINQVYLLPILIGYNEGCGLPTGWEDGKSKVDPKSEEVYKARQMRFNQSTTSILNMMKFTDTDLNYLNCIVLSPSFISVSMH